MTSAGPISRGADGLVVDKLSAGFGFGTGAEFESGTVRHETRDCEGPLNRAPSLSSVSRRRALLPQRAPACPACVSVVPSSPSRPRSLSDCAALARPLGAQRCMP